MVFCFKTFLRIRSQKFLKFSGIISRLSMIVGVSVAADVSTELHHVSWSYSELWLLTYFWLMLLVVCQIAVIRELKNHGEVHDEDVCWLGKDWNENVSKKSKKLKMQSVGRSTTTLNVNINFSHQSFFAMASFKTMQDLILFSFFFVSWSQWGTRTMVLFI